jgi:hypothetical protein
MKTKLEIERLAFTYSRWKSKREGYIAGYEQCQKDNADKLNEAVSLLDKLVENTELFFGYDEANKNSNVRNAKTFINSLNKQG